MGDGRSGRRSGQWWRTGLFVLPLAAILVAVLTSGGRSAALPTLGTGQVPLAADTTVEALLDEIDVDGNSYGTGTDFVDAFDSSAFTGISLEAAGSAVLVTDDAFTVAANATLPGTSGLAIDIVVHAEAATPGDAAALVVAMHVSDPADRATLGELLPLVDGKAGVADLAADTIGVVAFDGAGDIDALPGESADFVAEALGEATVPAPLADTSGGAVSIAGDFDAGAGWDEIVDIVGADGQTGMPVRGVVAASVSDLTGQHAGSVGRAVLAALDLDVTATATGPSWTSDPVTLALSSGSADWTFDVNYNQASENVQVSGAGASWDATVPHVFETPVVFGPDLYVSQNLGETVTPSIIRVGGTIDTFTVPNTSIDIDVAAQFTKNGTNFSAALTGTATVDGNSVTFAITPSLSDGAPAVGLTATFPDLDVAGLETMFGSSLLNSGDIPPSFRTTSISNPVISISIAADVFRVGATGKLETSVFDGDATVPASLMVFADLGTTPSAMIGVSPSERPIGGDGAAGDAIMLSDIVPGLDAAFDVAVYDADDPTVGFGVVFSTDRARIGGDPCSVSTDPCPTLNTRQTVTTNVAQWLMPLWGYDGSNEALTDSTSLTGSCTICSFRTDYQPATSFIVPQGLTTAGSFVMPHPIGAQSDTSACTSDPGSQACADALGLLGAIGFDSRVTITGTIPIPGSSMTDVGLTLGVSLLDASVADRPTWLHDASLGLSMTSGPSGFQLGVLGTMDVAVKQGLSGDQAAAMFAGNTDAIAANTLAPAGAADCARGGVKKVERDGTGGFTAGETYCNDLLRLMVSASIEAGPDGVAVDLIGDAQSILESGDPNPDGWRPMGFDKFAIGQVTATLGVESGSSGTSVTLGGAFSGSIETTPNIPFSAALELGFLPNLVEFNGMRLNVAQVSLDNMVEIYEWVSGQNVPDGIELPGVSLRNVAINIGTDDIQPLCIQAGFVLSGDLYISDDAGPSDLPLFSCDANPTSATFGQLSPAPTAACDQADIEAGCVAGIRLAVNDRGLVGDAFIAAFDAGPVHVLAPAVGETGEDGRGVSLRFEVTTSGAFIHFFGGAALGGTESSSGCSLGAYCDAWANGDFNAKLTATLSGADVKLYGQVTSALPAMNYKMLVAGQFTANTAGLTDLFGDGTIPDNNFALHVELANSEVAPELDFAADLQSTVSSDLAELTDGLRDIQNIASALRNNQFSKAKRLLREYDADSNIDTIIDVIDDMLDGASDSEVNARLSFLLNGTYFGLPGIETKNIEGDWVCGWPQWGYGPSGKTKTSASGYPNGFCFLHKPFYVPGLCSTLGLGNTCTLDQILDRYIIDPIIDSVIAGIDLAIDATELANDISSLVLSGDLFRLECASFDWRAGTLGDLGSGYTNEIQLGLFVVLFSQDVGASVQWDFGVNGDVFAKNASNLATSVIDALGGTTPSTCWSAGQLAAFFGNEIVRPGVTVPARMATLTVVEPGGSPNVVHEGNVATATLTYDRPVAEARTVSVTWGDGTSGSLTVPIGATSASTTHTYADDGPSPSAAETKTVSMTDPFVSQTLSVAVTALNVDPSGVTLVPTPASIAENDSVSVEVSFTDPGVLDTHDVTIEWGDGSSDTNSLAAGVTSTTFTHQYLQNPLDEVADIEVTVVDKDGGTGSGTYDLPVVNVAPTITGIVPGGVIDEGVEQLYTFSWNDPGTLDSHQLAITWDARNGNTAIDEIWTVTGLGILVDRADDGLGVDDADLTIDAEFPVTPGVPTRAIVVPHTYRDDDPTSTPADVYDIAVTITDIPDGDVGVGGTAETVNDVAPVVDRDRATQTVQYSDELGTVTVTASDVSLDVLQASATITPDGGSAATLPFGGLRLDTIGCAPVADDRQECTWKVNGIVDLGAGTYEIEVTVVDDDTLATSVTTELVVIPEDAVVDFPTSNPIDVRVDAPGGDSPAFTLRADISELVPDLAEFGAHPGDIERALVRMKLSAVGPGTASPEVECRHETVDPVGDGYDQHLIVACDFDDVEVNTYHVQVTVYGDYWTGFGEDVVTVSDPSLGFATGGGWFYWPGTSDEATGYAGDRTNFGFTLKYNRKATNAQGSVLMIRHLEDGSIMRIKSNAIEALAIGSFADADGTPFGWASITAKATYQAADAEEPEGNHQIVLYVEDRGEPEDDNLWVELRDKDRSLVPEMTLDRAAHPNAPDLEGGNIQVPHQSAGTDGEPGNGKGKKK